MSGEFGTVSDLLFGCSFSHFTWWCLKEALGWSKPPLSFDDFSDVLSRPGAGSDYMGWVVFGAAAWVTWLSRNELIFNKLNHCYHSGGAHCWQNMRLGGWR
jgi:hypothetical protein